MYSVLMFHINSSHININFKVWLFSVVSHVCLLLYVSVCFQVPIVSSLCLFLVELLIKNNKCLGKRKNVPKVFSKLYFKILQKHCLTSHYLSVSQKSEKIPYTKKKRSYNFKKSLSFNLKKLLSFSFPLLLEAISPLQKTRLLS